MAAAPIEGVGQATPQEAWESLAASPDALLVDVRTRPEWAFVGVPDLSSLGRETLFCEWAQFPAMAPNPRFVEDVAAAAAKAGARTIFFLCRSGARSQAAALATRAHFAATGAAVACVNVVEGFEGDLDGAGRRGGRNGWKARGLPWRQS